MSDERYLILSLTALVLFLLSMNLSNRWVQRKERKSLEGALERALKPGEENSLTTWLRVPTGELERLNRELDGNPFGPVTDVSTPLAVGLAGSRRESETTDIVTLKLNAPETADSRRQKQAASERSE